MSLFFQIYLKKYSRLSDHNQLSITIVLANSNNKKSIHNLLSNHNVLSGSCHHAGENSLKNISANLNESSRYMAVPPLKPAKISTINLSLVILRLFTVQKKRIDWGESSLQTENKTTRPIGGRKR